MASAYGNTLTDLGRNIAEQKASEQALAGILAQVGAQKLAALNALAANRGRTAADREVGLDRNATMREAAVMEAMLKGQELSDRDRQYSAGIEAARELARIQGDNSLRAAGVPYGPDALKMAEALAKLQPMNPRVQESVVTENAERDRQNREAEHIAVGASGAANIAYQDFIEKSKGWWNSDKTAKTNYDAAIAKIIAGYGEKSAWIRPVVTPDGRVRFTPMVLPLIDVARPGVPQVPPGPTATGDGTVIPAPNFVPRPLVPAPSPPMAVPRPSVADLRMADEMAVPGITAPRAQPSILRAAQEISRGALSQLPFNVNPAQPGVEMRGVFTEEQAERWLQSYVASLTESLQGLGGRGGFGSGQGQRIGQELQRVKALLSSQ